MNNGNGRKYSFAVTFNSIISSMRMQKTDKESQKQHNDFFPGFGILVYIKGRDLYSKDADTIVIQRETFKKGMDKSDRAEVMENFIYYSQFESKSMESGIYDWNSYKYSILETVEKDLH